MLYLVHEVSPMRGAVFLIEIYHPVSLNSPKWPLLKSQKRLTVTSAELLLYFDKMTALD
jgi:hypothetical protein